VNDQDPRQGEHPNGRLIYAQCGACGRHVAVNADGMFRRHRKWRQNFGPWTHTPKPPLCEGSGHDPQQVAEGTT